METFTVRCYYLEPNDGDNSSSFLVLSGTYTLVAEHEASVREAVKIFYPDRFYYIEMVD